VYGVYNGPYPGQINLQYYQATQSNPTICTDVTLSVLHGANLDTTDLEAIIDSAETILWEYRKQTQQIFVAKEFSDWASAAKSCTLLIQGYDWKDSEQAGLAMAFVSATFMHVLRTRDRFISLAFFCGRHVEPEDAPVGGTALMSSFIAQLLQQHYADTVFNQQDINLEGLRASDIRTLCKTFEWLVRQLPRDRTLMCIIDSADVYEIEGLETDMRIVLHHLLGLAQDESVAATVKVLVTSVTGTIGIHEEFQDENTDILLMESLDSSLEDLGEWGSVEDSDSEL
jgi:hypothetical protein